MVEPTASPDALRAELAEIDRRLATAGSNNSLLLAQRKGVYDALQTAHDFVETEGDSLPGTPDAVKPSPSGLESPSARTVQRTLSGRNLTPGSLPRLDSVKGLHDAFSRSVDRVVVRSTAESNYHIPDARQTKLSRYEKQLARAYVSSAMHAALNHKQKQRPKITLPTKSAPFFLGSRDGPTSPKGSSLRRLFGGGSSSDEPSNAPAAVPPKTPKQPSSRRLFAVTMSSEPEVTATEAPAPAAAPAADSAAPQPAPAATPDDHPSSPSVPAESSPPAAKPQAAASSSSPRATHSALADSPKHRTTEDPNAIPNIPSSDAKPCCSLM